MVPNFLWSFLVENFDVKVVILVCLYQYATIPRSGDATLRYGA